ncbi:MAG: RNA-binding S4 domain-containing protein [Rhodospirillaceae bacterium]|nr:RNA-binding S4 domain-containing protein [Rhodospirillaceae bacterium]
MSENLRLDKWLWFARFVKSRSLATALVASGRLRVNGQPTPKAHYAVKPGDVLTFPLGTHIRVIKVLALGARRGPAPEAQALYEDLEPPTNKSPGAHGDGAEAGGEAPRRDPGSGRPTKRERRAIDNLIGTGPTDDD